jgi:hypothetical protein
MEGNKYMATEQIEFSLFDYFPQTQEGIGLMVSVLMDEPEPAAQSTARKAFSTDCGETLEGARKHLAVKFSREWYEQMEQNPSQAFEAICKDELLEDFRPADLREQGFSSESAYAIKLIWDRVSQRPEDDPKAREQFIKGVNELKLIFSDAFSKELFTDAFVKLKDEYLKGYFAYGRRLEEDPTLANYRFWLSLGERFKNIFLGKRGREAGYYSVYKKAFSSEEGRDWNWTEAKTRNNAQKENNERWERQVPEEVIRFSQEPSGVSKPEDLIDLYGFRGVQFGNWVEDAAGRYHVLCCGNALSDLAEILRLPRQAIGMYGVLGIAFGARGSGSASAHFEGGNNVINLTKHRGGGAKAHEWAHALDFNLYSYSHHFTNGKQAPLSGNKSGDTLPYTVQSAFTGLMRAIKRGNGKMRVAIPNPLPNAKNRYRAGVMRNLECYQYDISKALKGCLSDGYGIRGVAKFRDIAIAYCHKMQEEGREIPTEFYLESDSSNFYLDANERGAYWKRDHELFARAFEAWIEDELAERGMTNSYLVSGTCYGGPYPQGEEREIINAAFRAWWNVLLESNILQDERLWKKI